MWIYQRVRLVREMGVDRFFDRDYLGGESCGL